MIDYVMQGLVICSPLLLGLVGVLINGWVTSYRDDKHFYDTRFLDQDGNPDSDDAGYIKDSSGKLCPIIVKKYSFGKCNKNRYVEGMEVTDDGDHGLPFKMSLKAFRTQVIRGPQQRLCDDDKYLLCKYNLTLAASFPDAERIDRLEEVQKNQSQIILRDLKDIFGTQTSLLNLSNRFHEWEKARPIALAKMRGRIEKLEDAAKKQVKPPKKR